MGRLTRWTQSDPSKKLPAQLGSMYWVGMGQNFLPDVNHRLGTNPFFFTPKAKQTRPKPKIHMKNQVGPKPSWSDHTPDWTRAKTIDSMLRLGQARAHFDLEIWRNLTRLDKWSCLSYAPSSPLEQGLLPSLCYIILHYTIPTDLDCGTSPPYLLSMSTTLITPPPMSSISNDEGIVTP